MEIGLVFIMDAGLVEFDLKSGWAAKFFISFRVTNIDLECNFRDIPTLMPIESYIFLIEKLFFHLNI